MSAEIFKPEYIIPGTRIGNYLVCTQIGHGGGSIVYDAVSSDGVHYALKVSRFRSGRYSWDTASMMARRFARGIYCHTQLLSCPNVAKIVAHDWHPAPENGWPYMVQELVPGGLTIVDWAKNTSPSLRKIVSAFQALATACGAMADADICHRDLKPANILMTPEGEPRIVDFNSATHLRAEALTYPAASGQPGTISYLPPELCRAIIQQRTTGQEVAFTPHPSGDLHALGCILYEVLVGEHPYDIHEDSLEQLKAIAYGQTPIPQVLNEAIPLGLTKVVMGLLRKDPAERYQHGNLVAKDLQAMLRVADGRWDWPFVVPRAQGPRHHLLRQDSDPGPALESSHLKAAPLPAPSPSQPSALVRVPAPEMAAPPPRRRSLGWAIAVAMMALFVGFALKKGLTVPPRLPLLEKLAKLTAVAGCTVFGSCAGIKVRTDEMDWLARCPEEARKNATKLGLEEIDEPAFLQPGENVIRHRAGIEIREGAILAWVGLPRPLHQRGELYGTAKTGVDGASVRFDKVVLEDGQEFRICGLGGQWGRWPGLNIGSKESSTSVPGSELHPDAGYIYVVTGRLQIRLATESWPRRP